MASRQPPMSCRCFVGRHQRSACVGFLSWRACPGSSFFSFLLLSRVWRWLVIGWLRHAVPENLDPSPTNQARTRFRSQNKHVFLDRIDQRTATPHSQDCSCIATLQVHTTNRSCGRCRTDSRRTAIGGRKGGRKGDGRPRPSRAVLSQFAFLFGSHRTNEPAKQPSKQASIVEQTQIELTQLGLVHTLHTSHTRLHPNAEDILVLPSDPRAQQNTLHLPLTDPSRAHTPTGTPHVTSP